MTDDEMMVTEFELAEEVFVPAGDGEPAQWKTKGDLRLLEIERYMRGRTEALDLQRERVRRYGALVDLAKQQGGLTREDHDELTALQLTIDAEQREQTRRQAAIDRDKAASGYWTLPLHREPPA
jgi:hypothetical protein